jgi:hypothetical protein
MGEFFCIYSGVLHDEDERSDEHIVPYPRLPVPTIRVPHGQVRLLRLR